MSYKIEFDFVPAYELIISINAYMQKKYHKNMDLSKTWVKEVEKELTPKFREELLNVKSYFTNYLILFIYQCPGKRTAEEFLSWVEKLNLEEINNILSPYVKKIPVNLKVLLNQYVHILTEWNNQYFSKISPDILTGLFNNTEKIKEATKYLSNEDLFEKATNGMRQLPNSSIKIIRLIPQYHLSPMNTSYYYENMYICFYACDALPQEPDEPPLSLMRLTHCLGDKTRIKLLHLMSKKQRTFAELVKISGLAKSTVHHHLVALRGAGLIRLEMNGHNNIYSLRNEAIRNLNTQLKKYLYIK